MSFQMVILKENIALMKRENDEKINVNAYWNILFFTFANITAILLSKKDRMKQIRSLFLLSRKKSHLP